VEDADELSKERITFELTQECVIGLPTDDDLQGKRPYPRGCRVLARFPRTSTFYPATVVKRSDKKYSLRFDDDEKGTDGLVRMMKVVCNEVVSEP